MKKSRKKRNSQESTEICFYNDSSISSTLKEAITKDNPVTLHNRTIQVFVNEMFQVKKHFYNYNR